MLLCSGLGALLAVNASLWQTIMFVPCFATTHIIVRHLLHPSGPPEFYRNVILILPPSDDPCLCACPAGTAGAGTGTAPGGIYQYAAKAVVVFVEAAALAYRGMSIG